MASHAQEVVRKFCELCDWLMQTWQMRRFLFDDNPNAEALRASRHAHFFYRLQELCKKVGYTNSRNFMIQQFRADRRAILIFLFRILSNMEIGMPQPRQR